MFAYGDVLCRAVSKTFFHKMDTLDHTAVRIATGTPLRSHHYTLYFQVN